MKLALLGDTHFISPDDIFLERVSWPDLFSKSWKSFGRLKKKLISEAPDLVISLGDLVNWYTPESCEFALGLMDDLGLNWCLTPGNHDIETVKFNQDGSCSWQWAIESDIDARAEWKVRGVELHNRAIDFGHCGLILYDSAESRVLPGTVEWLDVNLSKYDQNIICTHVPLDTPELQQYILSRSPKRDMKKYVQSGTPELFRQVLKGRVHTVFTGHLHFDGQMEVDGTVMRMIPLSVTADYWHNGEHIIGRPSAMIVELGREITMRRIELE